MSEWVVTFSVGDRPTLLDQLDTWADRLDQVDAFAARMPDSGTIDVTVHLHANVDVFDAPEAAWAVVGAIVDGPALAVEVLTETEYERRINTPTLPELMGATEIADELDVSRQRVHQLRKLATFPAPVADLAGGAVWDARAVRRFESTWERKPGHPQAS